MKIHSKNLIQNSRRGFSLIELIVAMFILAMVMGAMVAVSVSIFRSYQKSRAIKTVTENVSFALNSMAKDVRMGTIQVTTDAGGVCNGTGTGASDRKNCIMVTRNKKDATGNYFEKVCYIVGNDYIDSKVVGIATTACGSSGYQRMVDFSATGMTLSSNSGFYSLPTSGTNQGWVEINLDVQQTGSGAEMETDSIRAQTTVSSRDYDWKEVN